MLSSCPSSWRVEQSLQKSNSHCLHPHMPVPAACSLSQESQTHPSSGVKKNMQACPCGHFGALPLLRSESHAASASLLCSISFLLSSKSSFLLISSLESSKAEGWMTLRVSCGNGCGKGVRSAVSDGRGFSTRWSFSPSTMRSPVARRLWHTSLQSSLQCFNSAGTKPPSSTCSCSSTHRSRRTRKRIIALSSCRTSWSQAYSADAESPA
mmetsp:Transcript_115328/g.200100  ORF Transcript_115328/g.200100 Transcript_115328/m.200100 type:complete len:210 (+) Transcript_115328:723-1352(+)